MNSNNDASGYAFNYLKGKLTKWRIISLILFLIIFFYCLKKFNHTNNKNDETMSLDNIKKDFIAKIDIDLPIIDKDDFSVNKLIETIQKLEGKANVQGLLLEINSPGGTVVGSFEIYEALRSFKDKSNKPIVALIKDYGASGAYLISLAADQIIAHSTSTVGSVGAIFQTADITELASKIGVKSVVFKSGPLKASPNPTEKNNPEANKMMMEIIDDLKDQFISLVKISRKNISVENLKEIEKAGIFTGRKAKEIGLVDQTGGMKETLKWLEEKNNGKVFETIKIDYINKKDTFFQSFIKAQFKNDLNNLVQINDIKDKVFSKTGFYLMHLE